MIPWGFYHPLYFIALISIGIPIVFHLLNRKPKKTFFFSSVQFFTEQATVATKMRTVERFLLLICRCMILVLIIVLFSQPFLKNDLFSLLTRPISSIYYWVDPTISMEYSKDGNQLWKRASSLVYMHDSLLGNTNQLRCFNKEQNTFVSIPSEIKTLNSILSPTFSPLNLEEVFAQLTENMKSDSKIPAMVLISDFQYQHTELFQNFIERFCKTWKNSPLILVTIGQTNPSNSQIRTCTINFENASFVTCSMLTQNMAFENSTIDVHLGQSRVSSTTVSGAKNSSVEVSLGINETHPEKSGFVSLRQKDPFMLDNTYYFVLPHSKVGSVLVISENEKAAQPLAAAIKTLAKKHSFVSSIATVRTVSTAAIDSANVILLDGITTITEPLQNLFTSSARNKVLFCMPSVSDTSFMKFLIHAVGFEYNPQVTIVSQPVHPLLTDSVSPLWQSFPRRIDEDVNFYRFYTPIPGEPLLQLGTTVPFLTRIQKSGLTLFLAAAEFGVNEYNNLCETGFFIPFLDRTLSYALMLANVTEKPWIAGIPHSNPVLNTGTNFAQIYTSDKRLISVWEHQPFVLFDKPGLYAVHPQNQPVYTIAVTIDPDEGVFHYKIPSVDNSLKQRIRIFSEDDFKQYLVRSITHRTFDEYWIILLCLILAELILWKKLFQFRTTSHSVKP